MATDTLAAVYRAIRTRLLTFEPMGGGSMPTLAERLAGGISILTPPDDAPMPYMAIRLQNMRGSLREQGGRLTAELELMAFHRPREMADDLEVLVDVADQAMRQWAYTGDGSIVCVGLRRDTLPPFRDDADPEVVQVRVVYDLIIRPAYLTQYTTV
jgi:hypothetical protein